MQMHKTMVYLPKELKDRVLVIANSQGTSQADVIRKALLEGLEATKFQNKSSAQGLLKLAELGKKLQLKGPKDLSKNLDKYTWDE